MAGEPDLFDELEARSLQVRPGPRIGPPERLSATMALSAIAFGVLILGVGFTLDDPAPVTPTLDVILTRTSTSIAPKDADFLAQASNQGGGDLDRPDRPREAQFAVSPKPDEGIAPEPMTAQAPPPIPETYRERLLTTVGQTDRRTPAPEDRDNPPLPVVTGQEIVRQSMEAARLTSEIERDSQRYAKRPKRVFVSASTKEFVYAQYLRAWVVRVERVGNLNLPSNARDLSGELVMTVVIKRDGSVAEITLTNPSGNKVLDDAAVRTVQLAEPFAPPPQSKESVDELYITRTWRFNNGEVTSDR